MGHLHVRPAAQLAVDALAEAIKPPPIVAGEDEEKNSGEGEAGEGPRGRGGYGGIAEAVALTSDDMKVFLEGWANGSAVLQFTSENVY